MFKKKLISLFCLIYLIIPCVIFPVVKTEKNFPINTFCYSWNINASYYEPDYDEGKPLLILVHGGSYGKWMWDIQGYSWIDFFCEQQNYPIFAIDCLGTGDSTKPDGDLLVSCIQVDALKKMINQIQTEYPGKELIWIGHSYGSMLGNLIAGSDPEMLDGLVLLSWVHSEKSSDFSMLKYLIMGDYIVYEDDDRTGYMYDADNADQEIIDYDNAHAEPMPRAVCEWFFYPDKYLLDNITCPVFIGIGANDTTWTGVDVNEESLLYENSSSVYGYVQPLAGHICMLHLSRDLLLSEVLSWLESEY